MFDKGLPRDCGDCGAKPGECHQPGCDVERCSVCKGQAISCRCWHTCDEDTEECDCVDYHNPELSKWDGYWPGTQECINKGWFAKRNPNGPGYIECGPDEEGAGLDFNRLAEFHAGRRSN